VASLEKEHEKRPFDGVDGKTEIGVAMGRTGKSAIWSVRMPRLAPWPLPCERLMKADEGNSLGTA
jgi:hypothetical protein